jgi:hypothetical protein
MTPEPIVFEVVVASPFFPRRAKFDLPVEYRQHFRAIASATAETSAKANVKPVQKSLPFCFSIWHLLAPSVFSVTSCSKV